MYFQQVRVFGFEVTELTAVVFFGRFLCMFANLMSLKPFYFRSFKFTILTLIHCSPLWSLFQRLWMLMHPIHVSGSLVIMSESLVAESTLKTISLCVEISV